MEKKNGGTTSCPFSRPPQKWVLLFLGPFFLVFLFLLHLARGCLKKTIFIGFFAHPSKASSDIMQQQSSTIKFLTLHPSKKSEIINYAMLGSNITSKMFGEFFCAMGRWFAVMGSSLVSLVGSESWKRSIARKVSDGVGVDGVGSKFPFLRVFAVSPWPKIEGQSTATAWKCAENTKIF